MPRGQQTRKRELALAALLTEATVELAAQKAQVSTRTLKNWLAEPSFAAEFRERARAVLDNATAFVNAATTEAVATLRRSLTCGKPSTEVRAADSLLGHACKLGEMMDIVKRLEALERALANRLTPPNGGTEPMRNGHASEHQGTSG